MIVRQRNIASTVGTVLMSASALEFFPGFSVFVMVRANLFCPRIPSVYCSGWSICCDGCRDLLPLQGDR